MNNKNTLELIVSFCDTETRLRLSRTCKSYTYILFDPLINEMLHGHVNMNKGRIIREAALREDFQILKLFCKYTDFYYCIEDMSLEIIEFLKKNCKSYHPRQPIYIGLYKYSYTLHPELYQPKGSLVMTRLN